MTLDFHRFPCLIQAMIIASFLLSACGDSLSSDLPEPVLVTLPASTPQPPTPTGDAPPTDVPPTPEMALSATPVPPTPIPPDNSSGVEHLLWEWDEVAPPSALAATRDRLAVIIADGRFCWLNAGSGRMASSAYLWSGLLQLHFSCFSIRGPNGLFSRSADMVIHPRPS